jgi:hypothetical protein
MAALFLSLSMLTAADAFGSDDRWTAGWGQGIAEAIITKGPGNQIYVTCGENYGRPGHTAIGFMLVGREPIGSTITLTFDGIDPQDFSLWNGRVPSDCHACEANYSTIISMFKRHQSVHVRFENGDAAKFTLKGAAKAIGHCKPDLFAY